MSRSTTDSRQIVNRTLLDMITNKTTYAGTDDAKPANSAELDNTLAAINSDLTPPVLMSESTTPDLIVTLGSATIQNPETLKKRTLPLNPDFTGGTITLPAAAGGNISVTLGDDITLTMSVSSFIKILVEIDENDEIVATLGVEGASEAVATLPIFNDGNSGIGYLVVATDGGGNVQIMSNADIYQFTGSGGGGGALAPALDFDDILTTEDGHIIVDENGNIVTL